MALPEFLRQRIEEKGDCPKVTDEIRNFYFGGKPIEGQFTNLTYVRYNGVKLKVIRISVELLFFCFPVGR